MEMYPAKPTKPCDLLARWQRAALLDRLLLGPPPIELLSFTADSNKMLFEGLQNDLSGSYAVLKASKGAGVLIYGQADTYPEDWDVTAQMEHDARKRIAASLPASLQTLIKPMIHNSTGWSFAMWADSMDGPWQDLTDKDPLCLEFSRMGDSMAFLASEDEVVFWIIEQMEAKPENKPETLAILKGPPLTLEISKALCPDESIEDILAFATGMGYPTKM